MSAAATLRRDTDAVSPDVALGVAHTDAAHAYRDLSSFYIRVSLEADGWHIDYELRNPHAQGGGPHYVIDAKTGVILSKRYDQ